MTSNGRAGVLTAQNPVAALTVGTVQDFLDEYLKTAPAEAYIDYIHGRNPAIELAKANAEATESDTKFIFEAGDAATLERCFKRFGAPDLLVTDPPRAGMDERTVQAILKHKPSRLVLVSCNPSTLARDLALLAPLYNICVVQPVDLFPQTPHIETVVSMVRK